MICGEECEDKLDGDEIVNKRVEHVESSIAVVTKGGHPAIDHFS